MGDNFILVVDDADQILGLTLGTDDYISKSFNRMLLIAKFKFHTTLQFDKNKKKTILK
ncbi:hypothetical protein [Clostridium hydrogenum]|uniref:hypothetical protein n=1 Tax=Clostridium hydrogenum TaxID=2855764 RepID=UPI001F491649|nr:hypothetical protein [Clostridium hydrogenum]